MIGGAGFDWGFKRQAKWGMTIKSEKIKKGFQNNLKQISDEIPLNNFHSLKLLYSPIEMTN